MAEVQIPGELILPEPQNERERQLFLMLQDQHRQIISALSQISELI